MKTLEIPLPNKERLMMVEVPVGALFFKEQITDSRKDAEVLGYYSSQSGIDFPEKVKEKWVTRYSWMYRDYANEAGGLAAYSLSYQDSFISLLKHETEKHWPLKENPMKERPNKSWYEHEFDKDKEYNERLLAWQENESKVMPKRFVVLLVR